jgi:hypothetical protein
LTATPLEEAHMPRTAALLQVLFVVAFVSTTADLSAQSRGVELSGVVTDAQKSGVPGATVAVWTCPDF